MRWLTDPFGSSFMARAAVGVVALGVAGPVTGCWIVLRRLTYLSDAMSHAVLAGVAGAALAGVSLTLGAGLAAVVMALATALLVLRAGVAEDAAVGVAGQALFALGIVLVGLRRDDPRALSHVLFGNPLTVGTGDLVVQVATAAVVVAGVCVLLPLLTATTFDAGHARTVGIPVVRVETALLVGLGLTVVIGLTTVGVLMAIAMVVIPPTAARLVTRRLPALLVTAAALGTAAGLIGLVVSYHAGLPPGPVIALCTVAEVVVAAALRRAPGPLQPRTVSDRQGGDAELAARGG